MGQILFDNHEEWSFPVADRDIYEAATQLIAIFGSAADIEAATRASQCRERGNYVHFARWRQIERWIPVLICDEVIGTVH